MSFTMTVKEQFCEEVIWYSMCVLPTGNTDPEGYPRTSVAVLTARQLSTIDAPSKVTVAPHRPMVLFIG